MSFIARGINDSAVIASSCGKCILRRTVCVEIILKVVDITLSCWRLTNIFSVNIIYIDFVQKKLFG